MASYGGPGKGTSVFLRGANSGHTLVLVDGVRMGSATTGSFDWANLPASAIERIEIVRGPQSGLYGSDAIGGVIQIFTKKGADEPSARAYLEAGGLGSSRASVDVRGGKEGVRYALTAEGYRTRGVSAAANGTEPDSFHTTNWSASLDLPVGDGALHLSGLSTDGTTGLDGGFPFGDVLNYKQRLQQRALRTELEYPVLDAWLMRLRIGRSEDISIGMDPATASNNWRIRTRIDQWAWENQLDFGRLGIVAGVEQYRSYGKNPSQRIDKRMDQTAGFVEIGWHGDLLDATATLRHDRNSLVANKTTYRIGVAAHPSTGLTVFANYGTGFKAPSLNDLYWPASAWSAGNPNLKPESSTGWDAGIRWQQESDWGALTLSATYFRQDIR
ncbi:MAG: TonB-dependent receptor, partial [Zetaproteobacteria bacterium]